MNIKKFAKLKEFGGDSPLVKQIFFSAKQSFSFFKTTLVNNYWLFVTY